MPISPEALLISAVLSTQDLKVVLGQGVTADMFHSHETEWRWIEDYFQRYRRTPSKIAFKREFSDFVVKKVDDAAHFADEVRKSHARQLMLTMMQNAADCLADGDVDRAVKITNSSIIQIAAAMGNATDSDIFTDFQDILNDVESRARRVKEQGTAGIPTGWPSIDDRTGGLNPGEVTIVAARLGVGKSWALQSWAAKAALEGYVVQFDALEMSRSQVGMRIQALIAGSLGKQVFSNTLLMQGKGFSVSDYKAYLRSLKNNVGGRLHLSDAGRGRVSPITVASQIERNKPDAVYIDYIGLMAKSSSDWMGVAELSGDIQALATNYQIPVVLAAQLNRADGVGKRGVPPGPEALALGDSIGQDASNVITMAKVSEHVITARFAKCRNAPGDFIFWTEFDPERGIFREVSGNRAQQIEDKDRDNEDKADAR